MVNADGTAVDWQTPPSSAGGGGAVLLASTTVTASGQAAITLSPLPTTGYRDLRIRARLSNVGGAIRYIALRFGSGGVLDTGNNYGAQSQYLVSGAFHASADFGLNAYYHRGALPNDGSMVVLDALVYDYATTGLARAVKATSTATSSAGPVWSGGQWKNTADVIDTVQIVNLTSGESYAVGSTAEVYGIPG
ncbi:MAG TPA: hypothetical protein VFJ21_13280 [Mycobacteriales bacterium]|nr:hypothetical protein [Mycobacteriales bacterium]